MFDSAKIGIFFLIWNNSKLKFYFFLKISTSKA